MFPRLVVGVGALVAAKHHPDRALIARDVLDSLRPGWKQLRYAPRGGADAFLAPLLPHYSPETLAAIAVRAGSDLRFVLDHARAVQSDALATACGKLHDEVYTLNRKAEIDAYMTAAAIAGSKGDASGARAHTASAWAATTRDGFIQDGAEEAEATAVFLEAVAQDDPHLELALEQLERLGRERGAVRGMGWALLCGVRACVLRGASDATWLARALRLERWIVEPAMATEAWVALWHGANGVGDVELLQRATHELGGTGSRVREVVRHESGPAWVGPGPVHCLLVPATRAEKLSERLSASDVRGALLHAVHTSDLELIARSVDEAALPELLESARAMEANATKKGALVPVARRAGELGATGVLLAMRASTEWQTCFFVAAGLARLEHPDGRDALVDAVVATEQCKIAFV